MKEKTKTRHGLWLCCSVIEVKDRKNKKESADAADDHDDIHSSTQREDVFSVIFGQNSKRSTSCICCSMIGGPTSSPVSKHEPKAYQSPFDMPVTKGALTGVPVTVEDVKK